MEKLVRRPNAVILFISLSLLMMLTTSCQEIKLKAAIEVANKQCPMEMGEAGKITSIVFDGENVVYTFYLNEEVANIKMPCRKSGKHEDFPENHVPKSV